MKTEQKRKNCSWRWCGNLIEKNHKWLSKKLLGYPMTLGKANNKYSSIPNYQWFNSIRLVFGNLILFRLHKIPSTLNKNQAIQRFHEILTKTRKLDNIYNTENSEGSFTHCYLKSR